MIIITNTGELKVMKPLILKVDEKGKPLVTAEEIQNMVQLAYEEGVKDGNKASTITWTPPTGLINVEPHWNEITTAPQTPYYYTHVTCDGRGKDLDLNVSRQNN